MEMYKNLVHEPCGTGASTADLVELSSENILRIVSTLSADEVIATIDRLRKAGIYYDKR